MGVTPRCAFALATLSKRLAHGRASPQLARRSVLHQYLYILATYYRFGISDISVPCRQLGLTTRVAPVAIPHAIPSNEHPKTQEYSTNKSMWDAGVSLLSLRSVRPFQIILDKKKVGQAHLFHTKTRLCKTYFLNDSSRDLPMMTELYPFQ